LAYEKKRGAGKSSPGSEGPAISAGPRRVTVDIKQDIKRATELYRDNQYGEAEKLLLEVVNEAPGYANLHNMLGVIYSHNNQFRKAIYHFKKALNINPQYTEAQLNLAIILADTGAYDQAQSEFGKASQRERETRFELSSGVRIKLANAHIDLGKAYQELGLHEQASEEYQKAIQLCPDFADVRNRLGVTYRERGLFDQAEASFREALRINPHYADVYTNLGVLFFRRGDIGSAVQSWEEALRINPQNKVAHVYLKLAKGRADSHGQQEGK
jgi:Tfp pilus assembly protein PilF